MEFEGDPAKAAANEQKHDISFVDAVTVFDDPHHLEEDSTRAEHGEERSRAIGVMGSILVTVIYTDRPGRRRIIAARRARKDERERYDQGKTTP
jgi:uncharacterized DUF497 family protein